MTDFYVEPSAAMVREALDAFARASVTLPKSVVRAVERVEHIARATPVDLVAPTRPADVIRDDPDDADRIAVALLNQSARSLREAAWRTAQRDAAQVVIELLLENSESLATALADRAGPHIEALRRAAQIDGTLGELLRAGRGKDAELLAAADIAAEALADLYMIRDRWLVPDRGRALRTFPVDVSRWRGGDYPPGPEWYLPGLRSGGVLWFGSWREMCARATELVAPAQQAG